MTIFFRSEELRPFELPMFDKKTPITVTGLAIVSVIVLLIFTDTKSALIWGMLLSLPIYLMFFKEAFKTRKYLKSVGKYKFDFPYVHTLNGHGEMVQRINIETSSIKLKYLSKDLCSILIYSNTQGLLGRTGESDYTHQLLLYKLHAKDVPKVILEHAQ